MYKYVQIFDYLLANFHIFSERICTLLTTYRNSIVLCVNQHIKHKHTISNISVYIPWRNVLQRTEGKKHSLLCVQGIYRSYLEPYQIIYNNLTKRIFIKKCVYSTTRRTYNHQQYFHFSLRRKSRSPAIR